MRVEPRLRLTQGLLGFAEVQGNREANKVYITTHHTSVAHIQSQRAAACQGCSANQAAVRCQAPYGIEPTAGMQLATFLHVASLALHTPDVAQKGANGHAENKYMGRNAGARTPNWVCIGGGHGNACVAATEARAATPWLLAVPKQLPLQIQPRLACQRRSAARLSTANSAAPRG